MIIIQGTLVVSSETTEANCTKLYRNDVWEVFNKDCSFCSDLLKNMAARVGLWTLNPMETTESNVTNLQKNGAWNFLLF